MDPEKLVEQLIDQLKKDRTNLTKVVSAELSKVKGLRDFTKFESELKKSAKNLKENNDLNDQEIDQIEKLLDKRRDLMASEDKLSRAFGKAFVQMGTNATKSIAYGNAAGTATEFVQKFASAAGRGSGKLSDLGESLEAFGVVGERLNQLLKRIDNNIEAFRTLSQTGASFGQSIIGLRNAAAEAGLPVTDFVNLIADGRETLAALFGSTTAGAREFAGLANAFRRTNRDVLAPLGFTVEEVNDLLLTNLNISRRTGIFQNQSVMDNIISSRQFAIELDRLAKLTGQQRSELAKNIEQSLNNERFLARLNELDKDTRDSFLRFNSVIEGAAPELGAGLQDLIATSGVPVTEAAMELFQNIPQLGDIIRQLESGQIDTFEALELVKDAAKDSNIALAGVAKTGTVDFTRLFAAINKVASLELDRAAVLAEQAESEAFTQGVTAFEDASKRLAGVTSQFETSFFDVLGPIIGTGADGLNFALDKVGDQIKDLPTGVKATLFAFGQVLGGIVDFAKQQGAIIGAVATGTYLGNLKAGGGFMGKSGKFIGRAGGATLGATGLYGSYQLASQAETPGQRAMGIAGGAASGALLGATVGSLIPVIGTAVGAVLGGVLGAGTAAFGASRQTGTLGETGFYAETQNRMVSVERGERVLSPTENSQYQSAIASGGSLQTALSNLDTQMSSLNGNITKLYQVNANSLDRLNNLVSLTVIGNDRTNITNKRLADVGQDMLT
jgi:chemotaxis protein histidine kinase CheA